MRTLLVLLILSATPIASMAQGTGVLNCTTSTPCVALTTDITAGNGDVAITLTWITNPVADSCVASGAWEGMRAAAGTQLQGAIMKSTTYVLTCSWGTGDAKLSWVPPTENTDSSMLTDLAGFKIYKQVDTGPFALLTTINKSDTITFVDTPLAPATYGYQVTAFNAPGVESDRSATGSKTVSATTMTQRVAVTVNLKPKAFPVTVN